MGGSGPTLVLEERFSRKWFYNIAIDTGLHGFYNILLACLSSGQEHWNLVQFLVGADCSEQF